jgi:hypothetical protein
MTTKWWKVVIVGPTGAALEGSAFELLNSFPSKEEAENHAACFSKAGVKLALCAVSIRSVNRQQRV